MIANSAFAFYACRILVVWLGATRKMLLAERRFLSVCFGLLYYNRNMLNEGRR
jgi:hypothetical protein